VAVGALMSTGTSVNNIFTAISGKLTNASS